MYIEEKHNIHALQYYAANPYADVNVFFRIILFTRVIACVHYSVESGVYIEFLECEKIIMRYEILAKL